MENYSVLMAVYYREKAEYLRQAVGSMLRQTVPPEEFVLVCDGPLTAELDAVIEEFHRSDPGFFHIVRLEQNLGLGNALRVGLEVCRNELVARMDSDDIAIPDRMEKLLQAMAQSPGVSVMGGQIAEFGKDPEQIACYREVPTEEQEIREFTKYRSPMNHVTVVLRRSHVLAAGNYPTFPSPGFEDYFLWVKLASKGYRLSNIPSVCCKVRVSQGQYSRRGGWRYFQNAMKVQQLLLENGMISFPRFCVNTAIWFCGSLLVPVKLRRNLFSRFLRRQTLADREIRAIPAQLLPGIRSRQL